MKNIHERNLPGGEENNPLELFAHTKFFEFLFSYIRPECFLELGIRTGSNFKALSKYCERAIGVDILPHDGVNILPHETKVEGNMEFYQMTTDDYFDQLHEDIMFDAVFIDADHSHEQSLKDFMNVKDRVIEDGFIFFHDTYPCDPKWLDASICSDVYKTALYIKRHLIDEFEIVTLPIMPGVSIVKKINRHKQLIYLGDIQSCQ